MSAKRPKRTRLRAKGKSRLPKLGDEALAKAEAALKYTFADKELLHRAMTHPSLLTADEMMHHSNQRLEFLGDRVLGLVISERLMDRFPTDREGRMAPKLNALVNKTTCARALAWLGVSDYLMTVSYTHLTLPTILLV